MLYVLMQNLKKVNLLNNKPPQVLTNNLHLTLLLEPQPDPLMLELLKLLLEELPLELMLNPLPLVKPSNNKLLLMPLLLELDLSPKFPSG
jgi:hypothetical protein